MAEVWQATITDSAGNIIPRAVVDVRDESTGDLAPIFSDVDGLLPQRNPFFADDVGFARFYAEAGLYQVRARRGAESRIYENVLLGDASATYYVWQHQVSDNEGNALSQALVEFRDADTNALATLYVDENGSAPLENPFRSDNDGVARCYVEAGVYKIAVSRGVTFSATYEDVVIGPAPERDLYAWQSLIVNEEGTVQPGAGVLVTERETGDLATIYADEGFGALDNPFEADANGLARFYVAAGRYDVRIRDHCIQRILSDVRIGADFPTPIFMGIGDFDATASRSDDGLATWGTVSIFSDQWYDFAYAPTIGANGRLILVSGANANSYLYSDNLGLSWTTQTFPVLFNALEAEWSQELGLFVVTGKRFGGNETVLYSATGLTSSWSAGGLNLSGAQLVATAWIPELSRIVAAVSGSSNMTAYANAPNAWTTVAVPGVQMSGDQPPIVYAPQWGKLFLCTNNTDLWYSTDGGESWVEMNAVLPGTPRGLAYSAARQRLVMCHQSSGTKLQYSDNQGATWNAGVSVPSASGWNNVLRNDRLGLYIATASDGSVAKSEDGRTWVDDPSAPSGTDYRAAIIFQPPAA